MPPPPRPAEAPRVVAHRGASAIAPENTVAALREAARLGARWVEVDVSLLGDGTAVLMHDPTLDRTTDAAGPLAARALDDLGGLDAGSWFADAFAGERVATLDAALDAVLALDLSINLELKPHGAPGDALAGAVAAALAARPALDGRVVASSFEHAALSALRERAPATPLAPLYGAPAGDWRETAAALGAEALHCHHAQVDASLIAAAHDADLAVRVYTVNEPTLVAALAEAGLDAVFTDVPDRFLADPVWGSR